MLLSTRRSCQSVVAKGGPSRPPPPGSMPYPLQPLSDLRDQARQAAERELAARLSAVEQARQAAERAEAQVDGARAHEAAFAGRQKERETRPLSPAELELARGFARRLADVTAARQAELAEARKAVQAASQRVDQARHALAEAEQACEAVERHHQRWQANERRERERKEEAQQDDRRAGIAATPGSPGRGRQGR
jgi:hypothetical protein